MTIFRTVFCSSMTLQVFYLFVFLCSSKTFIKMNDTLLKDTGKCDISLKGGIKSYVSIKNELKDNITFEEIPNMPLKSELNSHVQIKIEPESDASLQNEPEADVLMKNGPQADVFIKNEPEAVVWIKSEVETDQQTELEFKEIKYEDIEVRITGLDYYHINFIADILKFSAELFGILYH